MTDAVDDFFRELAERGDEPLLRNVTGSVRFDVTDDGTTDRWRVGVDRGAVTVVHGGSEADCAIAGARPLLGAICSGRANAMAAVLRGELTCSGDIELIVAVQRLFPGPDDAVGRPAAGGAEHG